MSLFDFWRRKEKTPSAKPLDSNHISSSETWNDAAREELRNSIRNLIFGEIRLNRSDSADILETCRDVYIEDQAPENEWEDFLSFASLQIEDSVAIHAREQALWAEETDCDRLDRVEDDLRKRGILLWQVSPCCDTCSGGELPDRINIIEQRYPGFSKNARGYAFYIDQTLPEMLAESTQVSLYLAYGWLTPEGIKVDDGEYAAHALNIAGEVSDSLKAHGFDVQWNGQLSQKIGFSLNWQRRTRIE